MRFFWVLKGKEYLFFVVLANPWIELRIYERLWFDGGRCPPYIMIMPSLYTRTGDDGTTGLYGGERVAKDHPRIGAIGEVDELNAGLGLALASQSEIGRIGEILTGLQHGLFDLGADLATTGCGKDGGSGRIRAGHILELESWIDEIEGMNTPLRCFILPGGSELAARLHLARAVGRRAERAVYSLGVVEEIDEQILIYLNRLSDLLFALARYANVCEGVADVPWNPPPEKGQAN